MDFKVRALDFLSIYIKETHRQNQDPAMKVQLIQGLLKALSVAYKDHYTILFDRIKAVLTQIAKQGTPTQQQQSQSKSANECTILLTELMTMSMRHHTDPTPQKAYLTSFAMLTKYFYSNPENQEFIVFTYRELLKKVLGGRCQSIKPQFFQQVFEECPSLGWKLSKHILKCFLIKPTESKEEEKADEVEGSRSNYQRLQAVEIMGHLIRASPNKCDAELANNLPLLTSVLVRVIETAESWQNKKVQKTGQCVNLFTKAAKSLLRSNPALLPEQGAKLVKALERACEKDSSMSNLKGKISEIQQIVKRA